MSKQAIIRMGMCTKQLKKLCHDFSISIIKEEESHKSESIYYLLSKNDKYCKVRISCHHAHPDENMNNYDYNFVANGTFVQLSRMREKILLFLNIKEP